MELAWLWLESDISVVENHNLIMLFDYHSMGIKSSHLSWLFFYIWYLSASPGSGSAGTPSEMESARPSSAGEEELQLQLALAMSKEEHEEELRKQKSDELKLQMAIEQSKKTVVEVSGLQLVLQMNQLLIDPHQLFIILFL